MGREGWAADQIAGQPGWRGQKSSRRREALSSHEVLPVCVLSRIQLFATPWTVAREAPLSMGFSRQAYWSGLPFPPPGILLMAL